MRNIHRGYYVLLIILAGCQPNPYRQGQNLYEIHCESCHMHDGSGLELLIPSLESSAVISLHPDSLICLIRRGIDVNPETGQSMPPNELMNDVEMTNLINYLRSIYVPGAKAVQVAETHTWTANCH